MSMTAACLEYAPYDRSVCADDGIYDVGGGQLAPNRFDELLDGCRIIEGSVTIDATVESTAPFVNIEEIRGNLRVSGAALERLDDFAKLVRVTGALQIRSNDDLVTLSLPNLVEVGSMVIATNRRLVEVDFPRLEQVVAEGVPAIAFDENAMLETIGGFEALERVVATDTIFVENHARLRRIEGFAALTALEGRLELKQLPLLTEITAFTARPSGVVSLTFVDTGFPGCELDGLLDVLSLSPSQVFTDLDCRLAFSETLPATVQANDDLDLEWVVDGLPSSSTLTLTIESIDGVDVVPLALSSTGLTFRTPNRSETLRFELMGTWDDRTLSDVYEAFVDPNFVDLPPHIVAVDTATVVAGFELPLNITVTDPNEEDVVTLTASSENGGTVTKVSETSWVYQAPDAFRGVDNVTFVAQSNALMDTHRIAVTNLHAEVVPTASTPGRGLALDQAARRLVYVTDRAVVRREVADGLTRSYEHFSFVAPRIPSASADANKVVFVADRNGEAEVFIVDFEAVSHEVISVGPFETYDFGHEIRPNGNSAVLSLSAKGGPMGVYTWLPTLAERSMGGDCRGGVSTNDLGRIVYATDAAELDDGVGGIVLLGARIDRPVGFTGPPTSGGFFPSMSSDGMAIAFASRARLVGNLPEDGATRVYFWLRRMGRPDLLTRVTIAEVDTPRDLELTSDGSTIIVRTTTRIDDTVDTDDAPDLYRFVIPEDPLAGSWTPELLTHAQTGIDRIDDFAVDATGRRFVVRDGEDLWLVSAW
jgi:hypothetical protein